MSDHALILLDSMVMLERSVRNADDGQTSDDVACTSVGVSCTSLVIILWFY